MEPNPKYTGLSWYSLCFMESTMHKSAATMQGPLPETATPTSMFRGFVAKVRDSFRVPIGYQDETGFHQGIKPPEAEIKWPAFW